MPDKGTSYTRRIVLKVRETSGSVYDMQYITPQKNAIECEGYAVMVYDSK